MRLTEPFSDTFDSSLSGWGMVSADNTGAVSNPPGYMRLASTQKPPGGQDATITVKKLLNSGVGVLTVSSVFTTLFG